MVPPARVAIAGGSLGGLSAGLLLRDLGHDVTIYERSRVELEQRGAGIGLLPETSRYLTSRAGLSLDEISTATGRIRYLDRAGVVVHDLAHGYRFSSWNTVYRRLLHCFGRDRYQLCCEVVGRDERAGVVDVSFADGSRSSVDLLVCADGIGSAFRSQLVPDARRSYAGYVAWRGMVPESDLAPSAVARLGDAITYYVYANSHILVYPIPGADGSVLPGERLINFVWYRNYDDGGDLASVLTDVDGQQRELSVPPGAMHPVQVAEMRAVAQARLPSLLADVVGAVNEPFLQVVYDVEVSHMAVGSTCLIGDAGFVARPHAAAGTAKAAENAWALADSLTEHDSIPAALSAWEAGQMDLGRQLLARTRRLGSRSQVTCTWDPLDRETLFSLRGAL
jgi:2,6-dihydroxypyridine 3-monooxygenase